MKKRYIGLLMVLTGSTLWGLSGTVAQWLFEWRGFQPGWLVTIRLIISGVMLLLVLAPKTNIWTVWNNGKDRLQLVVFGVAGMLTVQYTYFAAVETGNAAAATLLQFLGPVFLTVYLALRMREMPSNLEVTSVSLALLGTFLLVTNGSFESLTISATALIWGLTSAVALAFYTLYPKNLLDKWGAALVVGWGMLIGGVGLSFVYPPWQSSGQQWSGMTLPAVGFVIIFGTLIAFYLYLASMSYITPTETSILASAEPLSASAAAIIWLNVPFGIYQTLGGLSIIGTVILLSLATAKNMPEKEGGYTERDR